MYKRLTPILLFSTTLTPTVHAEDTINFVDHIRPIMQQSCFNCHNADRARGGLDLTTYSALMAGGSGGEIVVAQDPDGSRLLGVMAHTLEPKMPPNGGKVGDDKLTTVRLWIEQGLRETADSTAAAPSRPRVDLSVGEAAIGRPDGPPIMPVDMPLGPVHHTPRPGAIAAIAGHPWSPIVAVSGQQQVLVYHTATGELLGVLPYEYGQPEALRFSWTGRLLMVGGGIAGQSGTVALYDVETGEEVVRVGEEVDAVLAADIDPTQRIVALGGPSKLVKGYDVATGELAYKIDKHTEWITSVAFSPAGDYLATADRNGGLHVWEADTGLPVLTLDGHRVAVTGLAWRFDGKLLASVGEDGQVKLWELEEGKQVKAWNAHDGGARSVAYAEDGRLVTTGRDRQMKVWDGEGKQLHRQQPFAEMALSAAFDTTGQAVVAGDLNGKLVRWSLQGEASEVAEWDSNPPPVMVALTRSTEASSAAAETMEQHRALLGQHRGASAEARRVLTETRGALEQARVALEAREQDQKRARDQQAAARERRQAAVQALRASREQLAMARDRMRSAEAESAEARKQHQQAIESRRQLAADLEAKRTQLAQAQQAREQSPDDPTIGRRVEQLLRETGELEARQAEAVAVVDRLSETLATAEETALSVKRGHEAARAEADRADQQHEATGKELDEATAVFVAVQEARDAAKAQADRLERQHAQQRSKTEQADQALRAAEQSAAEAEASAAHAARAHAKWRSAELRLEMDALRARLAEARLAEHPFVMARDERLAARDAGVHALALSETRLADGPDAMRAAQSAVGAAREEVLRARQHLDVSRARLVDRQGVHDAQHRAVASLIERAGELATTDDAVRQAIAQARAAEQTLAEGVALAAAGVEDAEFDLEDAMFDVESSEFAMKKLDASLAALPGEIEEARRVLADTERSLAEAERSLIEARKPGEALQAEIDAHAQRYRALRIEAGFIFD